MINGYYVVYRIAEWEIGVQNKIQEHINIFSTCSNIKKLIIPQRSKKFSKFYSRFPFEILSYNYQIPLNIISANGYSPDFLYIRRGLVDRYFLRFLKQVKELYPKCKIIFELPTYPYDDELSLHWFNLFMLKKDCYYRKQLMYYVDRIVTYSKEDFIFNIKTIKIQNGVDCHRILPITNYYLDCNCIRLIGVARFSAWHGYERLIRGMKKYYQTNPLIKIYLTLAGIGPSLKEYKQEVHKAQLEKYVQFTGNRSGLELDSLYNNADIAVSVLGAYKQGKDFVSALKNREYLSKGLPIITGCHDYVLENNPYCLFFANDSSDIPIEEIVSFYHKIYKNGKKKIVNAIREIALHRADITKSFEPVISYILERPYA